MRRLLDLNVLIALGWSNHPHHETSRTWFTSDRALAWATTPATELGFVRLSCNPSVVAAAAAPTDAARMLARLTKENDHDFWPDSTRAEAVDWAATTSYRHVPDTHLLAVAAAHAGVVATLDRALADRGGALVELIGVR